MARKTIRIDLEAYTRLKLIQKPQETFSQTIKRVVPLPINLDAWLKRLERNPLSAKAAAAIEQAVQDRSPRARKHA